MTLKEKVTELLKTGWYSNFQINMQLKSSSADREMRRIRENPPSGWIIVQRKKLYQITAVTINVLNIH